MSGGNLSGVYHFYTMAVSAATTVWPVSIYIYYNSKPTGLASEDSLPVLLVEKPRLASR